MVHIFTDMSLSGSKIGLLLDNYNYHLTQVRYCRKLSDAELGYKMYIDETYDRVLMLPYDQVSALPELAMGIERGIALRYANKASLKVLRKWSQIKAEAADIKSKTVGLYCLFYFCSQAAYANQGMQVAKESQTA